MKQRDKFIDVAKGLAMLLIVRIHTECMTPLGIPYPIIAVPFFFFLSGMYDRSDKPLSQWLPKTFKSLVVTSIIWNAIGYFYMMSLQYIKDGNPNWGSILKEPFVGDRTIWFLVTLFATKLIIAMIVKIRMSKFFLLTITISIAWLSSIWHPYIHIDRVFTALPLYYGGKIAYPYFKRIIDCKALLILGIVSISYMWQFSFPYTLVEMTVGMNGIYYPLYLIMTFLAFVPLLYISSKLQNWRWMANFGTKTLGTLVLHPLMLHTCAVGVNRIFAPESTIWFITFVIVYIVVCVCCYYITAFIERYCPVLLGKF